MKKTITILIFLILTIFLFADVEPSSEKDNLQEYKIMLDMNLQAKFNKEGYRWEVIPIGVSYKLFETPLYLGCDLMRFSGIEEDSLKKGSLNNYANLSLLPVVIFFDYHLIEMSNIALIPAAFCLLPNALTNLRFELIPWDNKFLFFFAGTNGDFYLVKDKPELLYSYEAGIGFTLGEISPACFKFFYSKDIQNLSVLKREESIGISFGLRIDL